MASFSASNGSTTMAIKNCNINGNAGTTTLLVLLLPVAYSLPQQLMQRIPIILTRITHSYLLMRKCT
jgi:hypothetical protein